MNRLAVVEKFVSINGEGTHAGELAVFLRFRGCNLNCGFCDTKWANAADAPATEESAEELVEYVRQTGVQNVTLTGGEPLLQPHIGELSGGDRNQRQRGTGTLCGTGISPLLYHGL